MRVAIGGIWHETLTFSPARTTLDDFRRFQLSEGGEVIERNRGVANEIGGFIETGYRLGFEIVPLVFAGALPSPTVSSETYAFLRTRMLDGLRTSMPVDGVLLALHGAMAAEGVDDVEADLLAAIREVVGAVCPMVVTLDLHANLTENVAALADVIVGYDTYPHIDIHARGCEAAEILQKLLAGTPVQKSFRKLPLLTAPQAQGTSDEPMESVMRSVHEIESQPGILCATVTSGYPYCDVPRLGMAVLVYSTTGRQLAVNCCNKLANLIWSRRADFTVQNVSAAEAVREAIASGDGPVVLVDVADNIGGGTPGDGTVLLRELLSQRAQGAVITVVDPPSVATAITAGVNREVDIEVGGKCDSFHGEPVVLSGIVRRISDGVYTHRGSYMTGLRVEMGRTAVVESGGLEVVLMERKAMPFDAEQLRCLGIEPSERKIIVVKSALAWKAAYGDLARRTIYVDTPGLCSSNLFSFAYRNRPRPIYPLEVCTSDAG